MKNENLYTHFCIIRGQVVLLRKPSSSSYYARMVFPYGGRVIGDRTILHIMRTETTSLPLGHPMTN